MKRIKVIQMQPERVTGSVEYFSEASSVNERLREENTPSSAFTPEERNRIEGFAELKEIDSTYVLEGTLNSRVSKSIRSVVFRVIARNDRQMVVWDRLYRIMISIGPASSGAFKLPLSGIQDVASLSWALEEVHGGASSF